MEPSGKKPAVGQLSHEDRLSELPDDILHHITSFLGTKEACRTSILSKRWICIWATSSYLDLKYTNFMAEKDFRERGDFDVRAREANGRLIDFIENTMRRYANVKLSISKLTLELGIFDPKLGDSIDEWLGIAVQNQVEEFSFSLPIKDSLSYTLPQCLFTAKALVKMTCSQVNIPSFEAFNLISLRSLHLSSVHIEGYVLQHIIVSCPLKVLRLRFCTGLKDISIPHCSKLEELEIVDAVPEGGTIRVDTSSLCVILYHSDGNNDHWPFVFEFASMKNLRMLCVCAITILDEIAHKLVSKLPVIETLVFFGCVMPKDVRISNTTLQKLSINGCYGVMKVTLDAPKLEQFVYNGYLQQLSSVVNCHGSNVDFHFELEKCDTQVFLRLKELMEQSHCKRMEVTLNGYTEVEINEGELNKIRNDAPHNLRQLKLSVSPCFSAVTSLPTLLDALFCTCCPDILSLDATSRSEITLAKPFMEMMENKVKSLTHTLKRIEVATYDYSSSFRGWALKLQLRLHW